MLFHYKAVDDKGINKEGDIDAPNKDVAISGIQHRGLVILSMKEKGEKESFFGFSFSEKITKKDVVIISKQISSLFSAQIPALKIFTMLAASSGKNSLRKVLTQTADDLQSGLLISQALSKHPDVFTPFYVNMVKAGEETGKLSETFLHLANYLDRQYAMTSKTKNALIYPIFIIITFFIVMILMFVVVIPKIALIIKEAAQEPPFFTQLVIWVSDFFVHYGFVLVILFIILVLWLWRLSSSRKGKEYLDKLRLSAPIIGDLYKKIFLSRIADNMDTMLTSGVPIIRAIDITSEVVDSDIYRRVLKETADGVKSGLPFSSALERHPEVSIIMVQMVKAGEESGDLGEILGSLAIFYQREVDTSIDTLVSLIEPAMIVVLGFGVAILLISILLPIYNMVGGIG